MQAVELSRRRMIAHRIMQGVIITLAIFGVAILAYKGYKIVNPASTDYAHLSDEINSTYVAMHCQTPDICGPNQLNLYQANIVPYGRSSKTVVAFKIAAHSVQTCPSWQLSENTMVSYSPPGTSQIVTTSGNKSLPTIQSCDITFWWNGSN